MRLAYADPPYPGKADRYPENEEVDHVDLIAQLCEYEGWALSTDERSLRYVIGLCPPNVRVLAWCRPNVAPFPPYPFPAWEPVLCIPARPRHDSVRSYAEITSVGGHMARENFRGQKPRGFCEWVLRCLGAAPGDTLADLFPGSGVMCETFEWFSRQTTLAIPKATHAAGARAEANRRRRTHDPLPEFERLGSVPEGHDFYKTRPSAVGIDASESVEGRAIRSANSQGNPES